MAQPGWQPRCRMLRVERPGAAASLVGRPGKGTDMDASAVYVVPWVWELVLGTVAIHRVQHIPAWAAAATMAMAFASQMPITTTFVR